MSLEEDIASWVRLDNEQQLLQAKIRAHRNAKSDLKDKIDHGFTDRGLLKPLVRISDGRLSMVERTVLPSLTLAHVKTSLAQCISDPTTVERLVGHIKATRPMRHQRELRRYYDKRSRRRSTASRSADASGPVDE
jgi:hypothetical protein